MNAVSLSGDDVVNLNNTILSDFGDSKFAELSFPNGIATAKRGKNGNVIFGQNQQGSVAKLKLRLLIGSDDDKMLNLQMANQQNDFAGNPLMIGEFIKQVGDGQGNITNVTYVSSSGVVEKIPGAHGDADGAPDQSIVEWEITFGSCARVIT